MKRAILITGVAAATANADFGGGDWGNWGDWSSGDWSKNSDCVNSCISDWSSPDSIISSVCPTGTITAGPPKPTLVSCLESACPGWFPASKWDSVSSKVGDACSSWSSCKTASDAQTYTLSYDDSWWSGKGFTPAKTAGVATFTGCPGGWDSFISGGWPGWGGDWDDDDKNDGKGGDWSSDKDGDWTSGDWTSGGSGWATATGTGSGWKSTVTGTGTGWSTVAGTPGSGSGWGSGDWSSYCDSNGQWSTDGSWPSGWPSSSSGWSYSCVSVTSTVTNGGGAISTIVAASPTTFLAAATSTGTLGGDGGSGDNSFQTIPPAGAAATAAVGLVAGAVVGAAMILAV